MTVSRLAQMAGIGVDRVGAAADRALDPELLRLENLDTDLRPPPGAVEATREAAGRDDANSYLPFVGTAELRRAAARRVSRAAGLEYDASRSTVISAGGLAGILDVLLATLEPGDEVILPDPIYIGLINRVRLAGGVPRLVSHRVVDGAWRLDLDSLAAAVGPRTRVFLMMSPAMPSGAVLNRAEWAAVCDACRRSGAWMVYDAAMEGILFGAAEVLHPASFSGMAERTITVGSVSKEQRMIGWRVGWIVAPPGIVDDIGLVAISNACTPVGIAQAGAAVALAAPASDLAAATAEWRRRRDAILEELAPYRPIRPDGGWSLLIDVAGLGMSAAEASDRLLELGRVAATPMQGWGGPKSADYLRLVFSNEPVARLRGLRERFDRALR
ncbi:MAG: pyridoxal phosphate-dependent aminotransferase [Thermoanaerobaculia bacterium]|nr:pyridoxal phosphate-dependent aminotransferase [Thermoanaerobaculia bacterium]